MLGIENLSKSYGEHILFDGINFQINPRERVGLVGRNGHGKTTLFRLIVGEEHPDEGNVSIPRNYRIGYVRQQIEFTRDTVLEEVSQALPANERGHYWKAEKILDGLGFSSDDCDRPPLSFSGGFQVRLNLAKALVSEPDLLLLDEPTNYLDITSIRWIERFLNRWPHELLLITHDRSFMDKIVTHTLGLHRGKVRKIIGDTGKYYAQIAQDEEIYEKTRINDEKRRREIELFITRFRAKARLANLVQSRVKTLAKMEKKEKLRKMPSLDFSFPSLPLASKQVLNARDLTFSYQPRTPLIAGLNLHVAAGDRICIIGRNGKGKTTLLNLLARKLSPLKGAVSPHKDVRAGLFEQTNVETLVDSRTVEQEILYAHTAVDRQRSRNVCGAMMFSGDDALKKIGVLSGGEKSRVMLAKLLVTPTNLLLLDEPTNHLDMDACDALLAALDAYEGTLIMVTHNEMFLHALARRLIVFQSSGIEVFEGGYQRFLDGGGWVEEGALAKAPTAAPVAADPVERQSKKDLRRRRSEIITRRSQLLNPMAAEIKRVESAIAAGEEELAGHNRDMIAASQAQDAAGITRLSQHIHQCQARIEQLYERLEALTTEFEVKSGHYDRRLAELGS